MERNYLINTCLKKLTGFLVIVFASFGLIGQNMAAAQQPSIVVTGTVTDPGGSPLAGVSVAVKGSNTGTRTDDGGYFSIHVDRGATLVVSFVGFTSQELVINESRELDIILEGSDISLDEVIVTGVATGTPKAKLGFSIEKISSDKLSKVPAVDAATALQGKVAGVRVTRSSGAPGSEVDVQLRGVKMIFGSSNPLYIIDGVLTENGLADINTEDIASIEVLKGAAASSLYGSRAANGVVSIMTKRGGSVGAGNVQVDFRTEYGKNGLGFVPGRSSATNRLVENGIVNYGVTDPDRVYDNSYPKTYDHIDQFFNPGSYVTNHLGIRGTSQNSKISVYTSLQLTKEEGVVKMVDGIERTNVRLNLDYRILDNLTFSTSNLYTHIQAFIDPTVTTRFWFTKSSGKLEAGKTITWEWEMYNVSSDVQVKEILPNRKISIEWDNTPGTTTTVDFEFESLTADTTYVSIKNDGFHQTGDELIQAVRDNTGGFTTVLDGLKAWLEYGIELNLVRDKFPNTQQK